MAHPLDYKAPAQSTASKAHTRHDAMPRLKEFFSEFVPLIGPAAGDSLNICVQ